MTALSSMEYPHWLMIAGALLLTLGLVGSALKQRSTEAEPQANANSDHEAAIEPETRLTPEEVYHRTVAGLKVQENRWMRSRKPRSQSPSLRIGDCSEVMQWTSTEQPHVAGC